METTHQIVGIVRIICFRFSNKRTKNCRGCAAFRIQRYFMYWIAKHLVLSLFQISAHHWNNICVFVCRMNELSVTVCIYMDMEWMDNIFLVRISFFFNFYYLENSQTHLQLNGIELPVPICTRRIWNRTHIHIFRTYYFIFTIWIEVPTNSLHPAVVRHRQPTSTMTTFFVKQMIQNVKTKLYRSPKSKIKRETTQIPYKIGQKACALGKCSINFRFFYFVINFLAFSIFHMALQRK